MELSRVLFRSGLVRRRSAHDSRWSCLARPGQAAPAHRTPRDPPMPDASQPWRNPIADANDETSCSQARFESAFLRHSPIDELEDVLERYPRRILGLAGWAP